MSELTVDTTVALPQTRKIQAVYPWAAMNTGDSFFVPITADENETQVQRRLLSAARSWTQRHPEHRYTTRRVRENGVPGVRCWRV